jgi:hypothetical protein
MAKVLRDSAAHAQATQPFDEPSERRLSYFRFGADLKPHIGIVCMDS